MISSDINSFNNISNTTIILSCIKWADTTVGANSPILCLYSGITAGLAMATLKSAPEYTPWPVCVAGFWQVHWLFLLQNQKLTKYKQIEIVTYTGSRSDAKA